MKCKYNAARILIVDDENLVINVIKKHLQMAGFEDPQSVSDSRLALETIAEYRPNLILLDIFMPHLNGLDLLQQIRANNEFDNIIVLMLSSAGEEEQYKSLELGAFGFIQKPTTAEELTARITQAFEVAYRIGIIS